MINFTQPLKDYLKLAISPLLYSLAALGVYQFSSLLHSGYRMLTAVPRSPLDLENRYGSKSWCLITGAANGIGKAWCKELGKRGFNIILVDIDESVACFGRELEETLSIETKSIVADLKELCAVDRIEEETRGLDISILVNNVGVAKLQSFVSQSEEDLLNLIDINLTSIVRLTHRLLPSLLKRNPRSAIIFMSSIGGLIGIPYSSVYSGTKGFLRFFGLSLSREIFEKADILIVEPLGVSTKMLRLPISDEVASPEETVQGALQDLGCCLETPGALKHRTLMKEVESISIEQYLDEEASRAKAIIEKRSRK